MEYLIKNLIESLVEKRNKELENIEKYKPEDMKDLILISSGKVMELDNVIQSLNEMLKYDKLTKTILQ
jgi:hypothetical protein